MHSSPTKSGPKAPRELWTERLHLRQFIDSDLDDLAAIYADPDVMRYIGHGPRDREITRASLQTMRREWIQLGYGMYATCDRESGELLGRCGLCPLDGGPLIELGYLLKRSHWGRGLATELGQALQGVAFDELGLKQLVAIAQPENRASRRVMQKLGMQLDGPAFYYNSDVVLYRTAGVGPHEPSAESER